MAVIVNAAASCIGYFGNSRAKTKPNRLNVPALITGRASTVQGGRRKALHALYNPLGYFLAFPNKKKKENKNKNNF